MDRSSSNDFMKKEILTLVMVCACALSLVAEEQKKAFNGGEFQVEAFGQVTTPDLDTERSSYGFGVSYYATESLGAGVRTTLDELSGHTFESISPRLLWRVPVGEKHAFYAFVQGTRTFHGETGWSGEAGPGYEYRPFDHVGFYAEIGMRKELTGARRSTDTFGTGEAGIRLSF